MVTFRRRTIREKVLQILYAHEISGEPITFVIETIFVDLQEHKTDFEFAKQLIYKVIQHEEELDSIIKLKVTNWEFNRIAVIDKFLLRMGICELIFMSDIPPKVTINEAIEIAKKYSTEKSSKFINGVLDSVYEQLKTENKLLKSGRGLISASSTAPLPPKKQTKPTKPIKKV
jgi:N utilization substance protein B